MNNTIRLHSGKYFDFDNVTQHKYKLEDIAWGLAHICRFGGHAKYFYSVAQHCVLCSSIVKSKEMLMHDASEAYIGDIVTPLKAKLPDYQKMEDDIMRTIYKQFNLKYPLGDDIHDADITMRKLEMAELFDEPMMITPLLPYEAYRAFLDRFHEL